MSLKSPSDFGSDLPSPRRCFRIFPHGIRKEWLSVYLRVCHPDYVIGLQRLSDFQSVPAQLREEIEDIVAKMDTESPPRDEDLTRLTKLINCGHEVERESLFGGEYHSIQNILAIAKLVRAEIKKLA